MEDIDCPLGFQAHLGGALQMQNYDSRRRYVKGSLANVDLDKDKKPDGFRFIFMVPSPSRFENLCRISDLNLFIDDNKIDSSNIMVHYRDKTYAAKDLIKSPDCLLEGEKVMITIKNVGALKLGKKYSIKLSALGNQNWLHMLDIDENEFSLIKASDIVRKESEATPWRKRVPS